MLSQDKERELNALYKHNPDLTEFDKEQVREFFYFQKEITEYLRRGET